MAFKKGNKLGKGGAQRGAGRDPDWLKDKCRDLIERHKLIDFVASVASGEEVERYVTELGNVVMVPANTKDRLRAFEMLADRVWGKAPQAVEVSGNGDGQVAGVIIIRNPGTPCEK